VVDPVRQKNVSVRIVGWILILLAVSCVFFVYLFNEKTTDSSTLINRTNETEPSKDSIVPIIPEETADIDALSRLVDWRALPVYRDGIYRQQSSAERENSTGDDNPTPYSNGNRDMNNFVCVSQNADYRGQGRFPIVTDLKRCPEGYVKGFVISRFVGSGRFVRLWITTSSLLKLQYSDEILRVYIDENHKPVIQLPLIDAISGRASPIFAPPFGARSRSFLAWYYPVVFRSKFIVSIDRLRLSESYYHQTDVVLARNATPRKASSTRLDIRKKAAETLKGVNPIETTRHAEKLVLKPGEEQTAFNLQESETIQLVTLRTKRLEALSQVELQVFWDDESEAAIDLPIVSLFASELYPPEKSGLVMGAKEDSNGAEVALKLPMPFRSRALWKVINKGSSVAELELILDNEKALPEGEWGHLAVQRFETRGPTSEIYHPLARATGRGRLVGVCLSMEGLNLEPDEESSNALNFLEGDERGVIDGELAIAGTGTEDYFNSAFYFADGAYATPFAQAQKKIFETRGEVVGCRWHILSDAIDYESSIDFSIEIGPRDSTMLDRYRSVAFLYR
jgi:hypothetical protein